MRFVGGRNGEVVVIDGEDVMKLGDYQWGATTPPCAALAKRILEMTIPKPAALKYYRRFLHREIAHLPKGAEWTATSDDVIAVIEQIKEVESEMSPEVQRMRRELPREGGLAVRVADTSEWGHTVDLSGKSEGGAPTIDRNDPRNAKPARRSIHDGAPVKK